VTEDTTSKRAQTQAKQEAVAEAVANYDVKQKLHALELLLNDPELKKAPTERAFEVWVGRLAAGTKEKLEWLSDAFATRYQRKQDDGTFAPRLREATTQQVVERLVDFALSAAERDRDTDPDKATVERHAALPDLEDLKGVRHHAIGIVKDRRPQPSADNDAEGDPKDKIIDLKGRGGWLSAAPQGGLAGQANHIAPAQQDTRHIGEAVPADSDGAQLDEHRIEVWKLHESRPLVASQEV
jgi:hypothetical protein